jgi:hypothetical protein
MQPTYLIDVTETNLDRGLEYVVILVIVRSGLTSQLSLERPNASSGWLNVDVSVFPLLT